MSIWRRIRKTLGKLPGAPSLGGLFERLSRKPEDRVAFTIAVIALGAKMAKADGTVNATEVAAFREVFVIQPEDEAEAARIFNLARQDVAGFELYAGQVAAMFRDRPAVLSDLIEGLVHIAVADGSFHDCETHYLARVAEIFGLPRARLTEMMLRHDPSAGSPWQVLGLAEGSPAAAIRARYRTLVKDLHPDLMMARGAPAEARRLAEHRLAAINTAYAVLIRAEAERAPDAKAG